MAVPHDHLCRSVPVRTRGCVAELEERAVSVVLPPAGGASATAFCRSSCSRRCSGACDLERSGRRLSVLVISMGLMTAARPTPCFQVVRA